VVYKKRKNAKKLVKQPENIKLKIEVKKLGKTEKF